MIDLEIIEFAKQRISLEIDEQGTRVSAEIEAIKRDCAARGMMASGNLIVAIQDACVRAANERAMLVWQILHRGITTVGVSYDNGLEQQLIAAVEECLPENMRGLSGRVEEVAKRCGMAQIIPKIPDRLATARRAALGKIHSEIRLFVMTLKKTPMTEGYSPQINIHNSTIGAVQTGHQSVANVNLLNNAEGRDALMNALDVIAQELAKVDVIPGQNKSEILELVEDGKTELAKERPNLTKLTSFLPMIGSAIGVVANLKPAYDGLKAAAALIGITLP
ncbi:hypothetical protein [Collimonas humicola]|uniref:hypothetical protein n=1 Tax=Collimonas humicola TaxID=2825886 RepID=UPI001B8D3E79|nr:hypothetical protein [Collimonas humicola]